MKKGQKITLLTIGGILFFALSTFTAAVAIKYSYKIGFKKDCYRVCYYNKTGKIWEYRPWGYHTNYTLENRDFPHQSQCLNYCLSQKQIDFIKAKKQ